MPPKPVIEFYYDVSASTLKDDIVKPGLNIFTDILPFRLHCVHTVSRPPNLQLVLQLVSYRNFGSIYEPQNKALTSRQHRGASGTNKCVFSMEASPPRRNLQSHERTSRRRWLSL